MDGSRLYLKVIAEIFITSAIQPLVFYPQLWPRAHGRKNEMVDVNSGNEFLFDALLDAISWCPPPEKCNYTSGWGRLQLLWLACSTPSILPAHFRLFSTAVFEFKLQSLTIIASVYGFNEIHSDVRERTKTWKNLRDVAWFGYAVGSAKTPCRGLNHIDRRTRGGSGIWLGCLEGTFRGAVPGVLRGGPGRLDLLFGLEMTQMSCNRCSDSWD